MTSFEQRSAFRIQMPDGQKRASLRIGGRTFDVQLVDASATGVAIACPLTVALEIDDHCELNTNTGSGGIRIVRKEVFADGILLGAERTGDLADAGGGFIGQIVELATWPVHAFLGASSVAKIGVSTAVLLAGGSVAAAWYWPTLSGNDAASAQVPTETQPAEPTAEDLQNAIRQVEALLPSLMPVVSESDLRAQRIFEQQKQLLSPETSRRLRLSPAQEGQIERALKAAEAAANDSSQESWEAIRRSELQILKILTPAQIKSWRAQNGA